MFNSGYKKAAIKELNKANDDYVKIYEKTIKNIESLQSMREKSVFLLKGVDTYIYYLANRPKNFDKVMGVINIRTKKFDSDLNNLKLESKQTEKVSGSVAGAGALAGAGVAALGPSAAMAVAMTFGTASTGTAIATLSGAAATNAALAWLGGGAIIAGGGGMVAGEAFLAMAGPIGWAIGGAAIFGGGIFANSKNKDIARKAEKSTIAIKKEATRISGVYVKVEGLKKETLDLKVRVNQLLTKFQMLQIKNYNEFNSSQKNDLLKLMNLSEALSAKIGEVVE